VRTNVQLKKSLFVGKSFARVEASPSPPPLQISIIVLFNNIEVNKKVRERAIFIQETGITP
ncbi:MAG: hypothetical protein ACYTFW_22530, partial [Planctomycetota bacterium]